MIKVCLDTNIYISALLFDKKPEEVLFMASRGEIRIILSPAILDEIHRVLAQKFRYSDDASKKMLKAVLSISTIITPKRKINVLDHKPDNRVLEAAVEGGVDYLVTGDKKHLLPLREFRGIKIVTPAKFLQDLKHIDRG